MERNYNPVGSVEAVDRGGKQMVQSARKNRNFRNNKMGQMKTLLICMPPWKEAEGIKAPHTDEEL